MIGKGLSEEVTLGLKSKWSEEAAMKRCVEKYSRQRIQQWAGNIRITPAWAAKGQEQWRDTRKAVGTSSHPTCWLSLGIHLASSIDNASINEWSYKYNFSFWITNARSVILSITVVCSLPLCGSQYSQGVSAISIASVPIVLFRLFAPLRLICNLKVDHFYKPRFNSIITEELRCNPRNFSHVIILSSANRKQ